MYHSASLTVFHNFLAKVGGDFGYFAILERLNAGDTQRSIARDFKLDTGQLSRVISSTIDRIAVPKPEIATELQRLTRINHETLDRIERLRERQLRVVPTTDAQSAPAAGSGMDPVHRIPPQRRPVSRCRADVLDEQVHDQRLPGEDVASTAPRRRLI